jgi:acetoin utilization protein AcuB
MKIQDMMSTNVVTITEDTLVNDARKIMEAHRIRRLPVMKKSELVGLVTKHMLLEAAPSPATSLNIWELNYLLSKMTVKEIMVKNPFVISPDMPIEEALQLGQDKGFGAFPVVEDGRLVGVVTESDIVRMMTRVLGVRDKKGKRIDIRATAQFGNMKQIMDVLDRRKAVLLSMMTLPPEEGKTEWWVMLRVKAENAEPVAKDLEGSAFKVSYVG